ncbi:MAG: phosphoribosylaminoimidazolesuccinocarboxamide synthase [Patescibacteria group bacterium]
MAEVPFGLQEDDHSNYLQENDLKRIHQGKVRDTYRLDDENLLVVASDRISIFDFVLDALIPQKGEVLTALTHFWLTKVLNVRHHLVQSKNQQRFNAVIDVADRLPELQIERCLVVKDFSKDLYPFEMIFRHHIGGSVFKKYQETGIAGGHELTPNLPKWSKLEKPIFTPSTKEEVGHDVNVDEFFFFTNMEQKGLLDESVNVVKMLTEAYSSAYAFAEEKGILIIDTKFEVAGMTIVDEILTPDSSRFVFKTDWEQAMKDGRDPDFLDKEPVRDWGRKILTPFFDKKGEKIIGINKLDPENPEHVDFVHSLEVPEEIIKDTTKRYSDLSKLITGRSLALYQFEELDV